MAWLREIRIRKVDDRRVLNKSQFRVVKKVAKRICLEYRALAGGMRFEDLPEPLRWCMHGGPGTGKTHVIKIIKDELFEVTWNPDRDKLWCYDNKSLFYKLKKT